MTDIKIKRISALIVDLVFIGLLALIVENSLPDLFNGYEIEVFGWKVKLRTNLSYLLYLPYFAAFDVFNNGKSPGKLLFGLIISPSDGGYLGFNTKLLRTLLKIISVSFLPITALIYLFFDGYNIHDKLMQTTVREKEH